MLILIRKKYRFDNSWISDFKNMWFPGTCMTIYVGYPWCVTISNSLELVTNDEDHKALRLTVFEFGLLTWIGQNSCALFECKESSKRFSQNTTQPYVLLYFKACGSYQDFRDRVLLLTVFEFGRLTGTLLERRKSSYICLKTLTVKALKRTHP